MVPAPLDGRGNMVATERLGTCAVFITPEASGIAVFSNETCIRLNGSIPVGGQVDPSSIVGDSLLWKNAQKNDTMNKTSETMNRISPYRGPFVTACVCNP